MVSGKHTPGPWKATESDPAEGAHVFWITAPQGCGPNNGEVDITTMHGNKPANARLIAAAPELLEALRYAEKGLALANTQALEQLKERNEYESIFQAPLDAARAAIAKAEGKTA
jgi:hypothetical protein